MPIYRRLPFSNLKNARDLGGHPLKGGGCTKWNTFIRSELPRQLSGEDLALLQSLGVTDSIDLRGELEVTRTPSALSKVPGVRYHHCPLFDAKAAAIAGGAEEPKKRVEDGRAWGEAYIDMAEAQKDWVCRVLAIAAKTAGCVMYNCTTGKDRTGLLTALLLGIAGVDDRDIIADYCVSQVYMFPIYREMEQFFPFKTPDGGLDLTNPFFKTSPDNMEALLNHMQEKYGGVAGYALACGAAEADLDAIRKKLREE